MINWLNAAPARGLWVMLLLSGICSSCSFKEVFLVVLLRKVEGEFVLKKIYKSDVIIDESGTLYKRMLILVGPHYVPWMVSDGRAEIKA